MRAVFMGTPEFAVPILDMLADAASETVVYTKPDAVSSRGSRTTPSPVKVRALELGLEVREPVSLRDSSVHEALAALNPHIIIVAAFGQILPREVLEIPESGCVNVHASLLPRWRGAAPVQRAILAGDEVTGVSIMRMEEGLDTGPVCAESTLRMDGKDTRELTMELAVLGARVLRDVLPSILDGSVRWIAQDDERATYAHKILRADVTPSPEQTAGEVCRRVRASSSAAPARVIVASRGMTLIECEPVDAHVEQGRVSCAKDALLLGAADRAVRVLRVRPDGRADMPGESCGRGLRVDEHARWGPA